ncbi:hypothetical protein AYL99_07123 [Fonsecaea erecta]|uniref:RRM domain-containing protein n=1 Tax=Fonsecaea erecta TaxID=1367422 RepID=A0A178ZFR4_9EURO|nr:hypothetical protein AYL99_07123 [Fonsecaea erecta]OAP58033.1 hypothetical protein AYL99_07123 [Fonsecaea erecta]
MSKKRKIDQVQDDSGITQEPVDQKSQTATPNPPAKSKGQLKQEKSERRAKKQRKSREREKGQEPSAGVDTVLPVPKPTSTETEPSPGDAKKKEKVAKTRKERRGSTTPGDDGDTKTTTPTRFIVFVGNLPYETTSEQIKEHFSKLSPTSVRHSTDKKTGKSKGYAFVEFDSYDKMKTCLKLYHHSMFDPAGKDNGADDEKDSGDQRSQKREKKSKGRRINVELTAGGGGKSKDRQAKIKTKNEKLKEERERRRLKEKAEREKAGPKTKGPPETGANATAVAGTEVKDSRGDIHPSRLSRVAH